MNRFMAFALCAALCWACKETPKEPSLAETLKTYTIEQMMDNETIRGGSFSPDKSKLLVTSNQSGVYNMYTIPVSGGEPTPVTASDSSSIRAISYFPKDGRMLFSMDDNGNEIYQIYLRDTSGTVTNLTPGEGARSVFYRWGKDDHSFFYGSNKRDNRFMDLYEMDTESYTPKIIYQNDGGYNLNAISDDKQYLALSKSINTNDSDLFLYDLGDGSMTKVNQNQSANSAEDFSPDGKQLYYTTDDGVEFAYLMEYDIAEKTHKKAMERNWDIMGSYFTENGTYQVTYVNEDAKNVIEVRDTKTNAPVELPSFENMDITSVLFSDDEQWMRFYACGSHTPSNLFIYNLATKEQK
ncbi:MAG: S9 family peptidase, partial [Flavobacteriaceae bacterium]